MRPSRRQVVFLPAFRPRSLGGPLGALIAFGLPDNMAGMDTTQTTTYAAALGAAIRERRMAANIGLRELARQANLSASHLCEIEAGESEPSASKAQRIAKALKIRLDRLLPLA